MLDILLVEDDPVLGRGLCINLEHEGYKVHWATELESAFMNYKQTTFSLVILDLGLPDGSGLSFLRDIRKSGSHTPVVVLTAKTDVESVVEGLQSGANDYIRKPFDDRELFARIKTVLCEPQNRSEKIRYGELLIQLDKRQVLYGEKELELSPREFDILAYFVQHAEAVVTRDVLLQTIDKDGVLFDRTIDSNISHVRARLKKAGVISIQISSIYGIGYRLEKV